MYCIKDKITPQFFEGKWQNNAINGSKRPIPFC